MDPSIKDVAEVGAWVIASIGAGFAAYKVFWEIRSSRVERETEFQWKRAEFRWKRAELAKTVLDETWRDPLARSALRMLDWTGLTYRREGRQTQPITHEMMRHSLRTSGPAFDMDEQFVRDCFDELFDGLDRLEHFLRIGLILFEDIGPRLQYYVALLAKHPQVYQNFLDVYGFSLASALLMRFESWNQALAPNGARPAVTHAP